MAKTPSEIQDVIVAFLYEYGGADGIDPDENIFMAGVIDSVGIMKLITHLEGVCGVQVPPSDMLPDNFQSVRVMSNYMATLSSN